ncbi:M50 family metallopeptidase [Paractinoplanes atraurantiacus]|uniref:Peptidase M50B-like n=1 Tax=Paractinoplanes atraurantiacus TaxID=1036182 RepID=A0A285HD81_9ACTN|nr:M50 family metallopeptidase [Actinoplanes atraurantiacus]SNY33614.1 Peptidase M50B-like [Actinoplanes atraurantiacus]
MAGSNVAWTAALLSWVLAVPLWYVSRFLVSVAHEGGHALLAVLLFRPLKSVRLVGAGGSAAVAVEKTPWLLAIIVLLAGYLGPSMFGLAGAWMLLHEHTEGVLWGSLAFLVLMLITVRGFFGWLLVPGLIVLVWMMATKVEGPVQELYTYMWVWLLLIGGVQRMLVLVAQRTYAVEGNEVGVLREKTLVPSEIWAFLFLLGTIAALVYGGALLLRNA